MGSVLASTSLRYSLIIFTSNELEVGAGVDSHGRCGHRGDGSLPDVDVVTEHSGILLSRTWARKDSDLLEPASGQLTVTGPEGEEERDESVGQWSGDLLVGQGGEGRGELRPTVRLLQYEGQRVDEVWREGGGGVDLEVEVGRGDGGGQSGEDGG